MLYLKLYYKKLLILFFLLVFSTPSCISDSDGKSASCNSPGFLTSDLVPKVDFRAYNHSVQIFPFGNTSSGNKQYYINWTSSSNNEWEHNIYTKIISLDFTKDTANIIQIEKELTTLVDDTEAQEPLSSVINGNIIFTSWEDGNGSTVDIKAMVHDGTGQVLKDKFILAGGDGSQHSASTQLLNGNYYVAYADEGNGSKFARVAYKVFDSNYEEIGSTTYLTNIEKDNWWPVLTADNTNENILAIWGDGESLFSNLITSSGAMSQNMKLIENNIEQYHYNSLYLPELSSYLIIAAEKQLKGSTLILQNKDGSIIKSSNDYYINRESKAAFFKQDTTYLVYYAGENNSIIRLKIDNSGQINSSRLFTNREGEWPTTGVWFEAIENEGQKYLLIAINNFENDDIKLELIKLEE